MAVIRTFIALAVPEPVQKGLGGVVARLQTRLSTGGVRWVGTHNVHLTLVFLGDVSATNMEHLVRELTAECSQHSPLEFSVGGLGAFPSLSHPRVIWVGIEAPLALLALQAGIQQRLERLGYRSEERGYSPHLTLGRVNKSASTSEVRQIGLALQEEKVGFLGTVQAGEVLLMRSDLHPGGPVYTIMERAPLAKPK